MVKRKVTLVLTQSKSESEIVARQLLMKQPGKEEWFSDAQASGFSEQDREWCPVGVDTTCVRAERLRAGHCSGLR